MLEKILVLVVVGIVVLLFFGNRLPQVMGDLGKGVKAFKDGVNEGTGDEPKTKKKTAPKKGAVKKNLAGKPTKKAK